MGKKNKKFKKGKINKNQFKETPAQNPSADFQKSTEKIIEPIEKAESKIIEAEPEKDFYQTDKYDYVKKDIVKILIIMISIIVVLFAIYFLSFKTSTLSKLGNWVYKITNIQTS